MNQEMLAARIAARKKADTVFQLCTEEAPADHPEHYWRCLLTQLHERCPMPAEEKPGAMSDAEANKFGLMEMPFGKYQGTLIDDVPLRYLDWLVGQPDDKEQFRRYLKNPHVAASLAQELEAGESDHDD